MNPVGAGLCGDIGAAVNQEGDIALVANRHQSLGGVKQPGLVARGEPKLNTGYVAAIQGVGQDINEAVRVKRRRRNQVEAAALSVAALVLALRRRTAPWRRRSGRSGRRR